MGLLSTSVQYIYHYTMKKVINNRHNNKSSFAAKIYAHQSHYWFWTFHGSCTTDLSIFSAIPKLKLIVIQIQYHRYIHFTINDIIICCLTMKTNNFKVFA